MTEREERDRRELEDHHREERRERIRRGEDIATLQAVLTAPKSGLVDRFEHLHECVEKLKVSFWKASGALAVVVIVAQAGIQFLFGHR